MTYDYKEISWQSGHRLIGVLLILAGIASLVGAVLLSDSQADDRPLWTGFSFVAIGLIVFSANTGTQIDLAGKRYKEYKSLLGLRSGDWLPLPAIDHLYKGSITEETTNLPNGISPTLSGKSTAHFVLLMTSPEAAVLSLQYAKADEAQQAARLISEALAVQCKG